MAEPLEHTVPAAAPPLPASEPVEVQVSQVRRWLEGYTDTAGVSHPGIITMVTELYEEAKLRRERREQIGRALTSGSLLAIIGLVGAWLKEHLK